MNMTRFCALATMLLVAGCMAQQPEEVPVKTFYNIEAKTIGGKTVKMEQYKGKVLLIVNTASKCGFTPQYAGLEELYKKYKDKDFLILGFPANNFLHQEPGSDDEIATFCKINYGVTFPMFSKISVKGSDIHPLYAYLTSEETDPEFAGGITWNFNKFLISRDGKIVNRFGSRTTPDDPKLVAALEAELEK